MGYDKANLPPLIFCGDFNSLPTIFNETSSSHEPSALFEYLERGVLSEHHPHHPDTYFKVLGDNKNPNIGDFRLHDPLLNIFSVPEFKNDQPLATTKTDDFAGWIDHVWVSKEVSVDMVSSFGYKIHD